MRAVYIEVIANRHVYMKKISKGFQRKQNEILDKARVSTRFSIVGIMACTVSETKSLSYLFLSKSFS